MSETTDLPLGCRVEMRRPPSQRAHAAESVCMARVGRRVKTSRALVSAAAIRAVPMAVLSLPPRESHSDSRARTRLARTGHPDARVGDRDGREGLPRALTAH